MVIPLFIWKMKCANDSTHGGQASNETSSDFHLAFPVTLINESSIPREREMYHAFDIAFKSGEIAKPLCSHNDWYKNTAV